MSLTFLHQAAQWGRAGAIAAAAALAMLPAVSHADYSGLYVFGDSLSDGTGGNNVNPLPPNTGGVVPPFPYVTGHFSNGMVAAEYLAGNLGLSTAQTFNYAIGGAQTGLDGAAGAGTGLLSQVGAFQATLGAGSADAGALYMVWAGPNDFLSLFNGGPVSPADINAALVNAVTNLVTSVSALYQAGARQFLVPLMPDLGTTSRLAGSPLSAGASQLTAGFNATLLAQLANLAANPLVQGETLTVFDTSAAAMMAAGEILAGGGDVTGNCLATAAVNPSVLPNCDGYFFFDDIHPTTAVHQVVGFAMAAAVPEPSSVLLAGLAVAGLVAQSARRRRRLAAVA